MLGDLINCLLNEMITLLTAIQKMHIFQVYFRVIFYIIYIKIPDKKIDTSLLHTYSFWGKKYIINKTFKSILNI